MMGDLAERALIIPLRSFFAVVGFAVVGFALMGFAVVAIAFARSEERPDGSDARLLGGEAA